jgi:hypothetical protein
MSGEVGSTTDRKSDKLAESRERVGHVNLSNAPPMFQAGKSADEELGRQPLDRGTPSPTTIAANPLSLSDFGPAAEETSTALTELPVQREKPGGSLASVGNDDHGVSAVFDHPATPLNERELLVAPDEHSIIDDDLLRCTPYIVNSLYMVLICTHCRHCINPDQASKHLRKHHPHCKVGTGFVSQLNERFPGLESEEIHPARLLQPVFGLAIPLDPYTVCARCHRGYVNLNTWRRHTCKRVDVDLDGGREHFNSHVQTFFRSPKLCYFPIEFPTFISSEPRGDDFDLFLSSYREPAVSEDSVEGSEDYRELNQFLLKEGWIQHLSGCSRSELSILTDLPQTGEVLKPVGREVVSLMSNIQDAIGMAGYHVRRLLGRRPP